MVCGKYTSLGNKYSKSGNKEEENELSNKEENSNSNNENLDTNKDNNEENDLINELYIKNNKHDNFDSMEGEAFRMNSFKPNPIPGSPIFNKNTSINNNIIINNTNNDEIKNNNNVGNFTETIETIFVYPIVPPETPLFPKS